jgi:hypothetical protein
MSQLTIDLQPEVFERLRREAARTGRPIELLASELLAERLPPEAQDERERAREVLRAAGLMKFHTLQHGDGFAYTESDVSSHH